MDYLEDVGSFGHFVLLSFRGLDARIANGAGSLQTILIFILRKVGKAVPARCRVFGDPAMQRIPGVVSDWRVST
jgi:hypothetical protein